MPVLLAGADAVTADATVAAVIDAWRNGRPVLLPTETGYAVVHGRADAVRCVADAAALERQVGPLPDDLRRILMRAWPGPVCVSHGGLAYRSPVSLLVEEGMRAGLKLDIDESTEADTTIDRLAGLRGEALAVILDAGTLSPQALTVIEMAGGGWAMSRAGAIDQTALLELAARWIVFVCTGNTCRSPMAEALARKTLADRLGCEPGELVSRGYRVLSAGVAAGDGDAASGEAVEAVRTLGASLDEHRSQLLGVDLVAQADELIAMTRGHLLAILTRYPAIGGTMRLLGGVGGDVNDPIGGPPEMYVACAAKIHEYVERLSKELVR